MLALPHTFTIKNSLELARELTQLQIATTHKTVTFVITDLYVNLPITDLTTTTKFWLQRTLIPSGFGGLVVSMLASGTQECGFAPGQSRWIFWVKKSSACLPSEGK
jgi:hypothetical protein